MLSLDNPPTHDELENALVREAGERLSTGVDFLWWSRLHHRLLLLLMKDI